jgi:hypothetical protein
VYLYGGLLDTSTLYKTIVWYLKKKIFGAFPKILCIRL